MTPQKRKLLLMLRRRTKPLRRFNVALECDHVTVRFTCKTCGKSHSADYGNVAPAIREKLVAYQNDNNGLSGYCPHCTKKARDERWPLK